ncbi:MAG: hypothetical protein J6Y08_07610 [Clostridiales bacterium]|nr:hypothetical protein [Clostridiales bacterium]
MSRDSKIKNKIIAFIFVLVVEAVVLGVICACTSLFDSISFDVATVPFAQIASGIKLLSHKGAIGSGAAMAILACISFLPIVYAFTNMGGKKSIPEMISLVFLGVMLGAGFYLMINPVKYLPEVFRNNPYIMHQAVSILLWSVILLCLACTATRLLSSKDTRGLVRGFSALMVFLGILAVALGAFSLGALVKESSSESTSGIESFVMGFKLLKTVVPYILETIIAVLLFRLSLIFMSKEQSGLKESASYVRRISCILLEVTLLLTVGYNLLQIVCMKNMSNIRIVTEIPVLSCAFVVVSVLVCNLLTENKKLKDDNDLFV